ncbi:hypothetical protein FB451DRAFT_1215139 [Mycena latifolia]|nr:hypothetical protein FB451DRAFT_1215139 [Mycena latifolia]
MYENARPPPYYANSGSLRPSEQQENTHLSRTTFPLKFDVYGRAHGFVPAQAASRPGTADEFSCARASAVLQSYPRTTPLLLADTPQLHVLLPRSRWVSNIRPYEANESVRSHLDRPPPHSSAHLGSSNSANAMPRTCNFLEPSPGAFNRAAETSNRVRCQCVSLNSSGLQSH